MIFFVKFIYQTFFLPPGFIILLLLLAAVFAFKKKSRFWVVAFGIGAVLYLSSVPLIGDYLINTLESKYSPPARLNGDVIIMLGGGSTLDTPNVSGRGHLSGSSANRLLTCLQIYNKLKVPIIISGGQLEGLTGSDSQVGKNILMELGIPEDKIIIEGKSMNTTQNARYTKDIVERYGFQDPILVTSAFHMSRSVKQFEKAGMKVTPYPADYQVNARKVFIFNDLVPSADALMKTSLSLKEYIGIMVSKWY